MYSSFFSISALYLFITNEKTLTFYFVFRLVPDSAQAQTHKAGNIIPIDIKTV